MSRCRLRRPPVRGIGRCNFIRARTVLARFQAALADGDGVAGAHCVHELWMRGEWPDNIERALESLWKYASKSIPDWLPMRYVDWLPVAYEVAGGFRAAFKGRTNIYLVLLDYSDSRADPHGVYVGMSHYSPADRFDQHKAGIRASGSVLKRGPGGSDRPDAAPAIHCPGRGGAN